MNKKYPPVYHSGRELFLKYLQLAMKQTTQMPD